MGVLAVPILGGSGAAAATPDPASLFSGMWPGMRQLCIGLFHLLQWLAAHTGNWGIAIIVLAILVRVLTYPMARRAIIEQKRFNEIQERLKPALQRIKQQYKGGEQSERIIALYKHHHVSPAAGMKSFLIVLLQLPVFIALFQILEKAPQLHGAGFLWIRDLASPDCVATLPWHLPWFGACINALPFLLAATILLTTATIPGSSASGNVLHRYLATAAMAVAFFVGFYAFQAGLVLYWVTNNVLQIVQQLWIGMRRKARPANPTHDPGAT